jgi:membrane-associated phospholipid phosphatase
MEKILDYIGFFGPHILFILNLFVLWKQFIQYNDYYLYGYVLFLFINKFINKLIKSIIKEPRPNGGKNIMDFEDKFYKGIEQYGMPSGHVQSSFFSLTYLYLVKKSSLLLMIELFITSLTFYQRWKYKRHTILQLCIGTIIGILLGYISFEIVKIYLKTQ